MKKVLFATNVPSPYRVDFFNELGKYCELTVCFERKTASDRDVKWKGKSPENFQAVQLDLKPYKEDRSRGSALKNYIKVHELDVIIFTNYVSPATMSAISWCKHHKRPFYIEYDGGFYKKDKFPLNILKKYLLCGAAGHLTTCDVHIKYLLSLGIDKDKIFKYPFSSLSESDLQKAYRLTRQEKETVRHKLGMNYEKIVLTVGRFTYDGGYGKGYDSLMKVAAEIPDVGFYIVGGEPTQEFLDMREKMNAHNVQFIGFKTSDELSEYYLASDVFVLLTRGDVWGVVINEAMSYSLPIITTVACNAGLEMVKDGENGFLVDPEDIDTITNKIKYILSDYDVEEKFAKSSREKVKAYTIENMAQAHVKIGNLSGEGVTSIARETLNIKEKKVVLYVGQFIHRKGLDILLRAAAKVSRDVGFYFIGGVPNEEYMNLQEESGVDNIHFVGFKTKEELIPYFHATDIFALPTREDIWGLVINEAMAYGLPCITTERCIAGLELIENGKNGYIVPVNDPETIAEKINAILNDPGRCSKMGLASIDKIEKYTIEKMAERHLEIFQNRGDID